ncbi:1-phosphofructokinase family hexose kinase [Novosphingobium sp.]|uniref:1-phosphofructokinase family hexose kinase n=1 Tax=Novosphingobium sp. TaxID=1874826 RepID=UPI00334256AC
MPDADTTPDTMIATLTMNPTIDVAYEVERLVPTHKMRTNHEYTNPGGGGINVARVFVRLGGNARCVYLSGGPTGVALDGLLDLHQLVRARVPIAGPTRIAVTMLELATGQEYRITPEGPPVTEAEWRAVLAQIADIRCAALVISGSLPHGVPDDFYAQVVRTIGARGVRVVLDTSGAALRAGLAGGGVDLVKPSRGELEALVGTTLPTRAGVADAAMAIVEAGQARLVAVTLGHEGALLARREGVIDVPALAVEAKSTVGAGDSFVAGMVYGLCTGQDDAASFRLGVAAGTAAVLHPGTDLARPADIARLLAQIDGPVA